MDLVELKRLIEERHQETVKKIYTLEVRIERSIARLGEKVDKMGSLAGRYEQLRRWEAQVDGNWSSGNFSETEGSEGSVGPASEEEVQDLMEEVNGSPGLSGDDTDR